MCGICGSIHFKERNKSADGELLQNMTSVLRHRGPDDSGMIFLSSNANYDPLIVNSLNGKSEFRGMNGNYNIGLGHQRLSIIDLSPFGHQPMSNDENNRIGSKKKVEQKFSVEKMVAETERVYLSLLTNNYTMPYRGL